MRYQERLLLGLVDETERKARNDAAIDKVRGLYGDNDHVLEALIGICENARDLCLDANRSEILLKLIHGVLLEHCGLHLEWIVAKNFIEESI